MKPFLLFIVFFPSLLFGQRTLVDYSELTFNSLLEENTFNKFFKNGEADFLALFMAIDPNVTRSELDDVNDRFDQNIADLSLEKLRKKKPENAVLFINKKIRGRFFDKYIAQHLFSGLFKNGSYNCVSATALYGTVFEEFGVPYVIRENPSHVYLVAWPEKEKILVEATAPDIGMYAYSDNFKKEFVKKLYENDFIDSVEYKQQPVNSLFDKYYFNDDDITLTNLVGIQYLNDAIYRIQDQDYKGSFNQAQKAWLFHPSEKSSHILLNAAVTIISKGSYHDDPELVDYLLKIKRSPRITNDMVLGEFGKMIEQLLIKNNRPEELDRQYKVLISGLADSALISEIKFAYQYEKGRLAFLGGDLKSSLFHYEQAYSFNTENTDIRNNIVALVTEMALAKPNNLETISFLEEYMDNHPGLSENHHFVSTLTRSWVIQAGQYFMMGDPQKGFLYLDKFESAYFNTEELNVRADIISDSYSEAIVYYFKKGQRSRALELANRGLKVLPGNFELSQRKRMLRQ